MMYQHWLLSRTPKNRSTGLQIGREERVQLGAQVRLITVLLQDGWPPGALMWVTSIEHKLEVPCPG